MCICNRVIDIMLVPPGDPIGPAVTLDEMLRTSAAWDARATYYGNDQEDRFCMVANGFYRDFLLQPHRAMYYRHDIALLFGIRADRLEMTPAGAHQGDISLYGRPCRTVVAIGSRIDATTDQNHTVLLDCRPILEGWRQASADQGWLDAEALRRHFSAGGPLGFNVCLSDCPAHWRWLYCEPGKVVRITFQPVHDWRRADIDGGDLDGPDDDAAGHDPAPGEYRAYLHDALFEAGPERAPPEHARAQGAGHFRRAAHVSAAHAEAYVEAGRRCFCALYCALHPSPLTPYLWQRHDQRPIGKVGPKRPFKAKGSLLSRNAWSGYLRIGVLVGVCLSAAQAAPAEPTLFGPAICQVAAIDKVCGLPLPPTEGFDMSRRPVPTPCRSRGIHTPIDEIGHIQTLLEHSLHSEDSPAMFLAATLMDTLFEHFVTAAAVPSSGLTETARAQRYSLPLCALMPVTDRRNEPSWPRFLQPSRFQLPPGISRLAANEPICLGAMPLGFAAVDPECLVHAPVILNDIADAVNICPSLKRWGPSTLRSYLGTLQSACQPGDIICYTDGSYTPGTGHCQPLCGWACIFIDPHTFRMSVSFGACPVLQGSSDRLSAYLGECSALLAAALVSTNAYQWKTVHFHSDCVAAITATAGSASYSLGGIAQACRNASSFRKAVGHPTDTYHYVPGHSNCLGNDLADALSKYGAKNGVPSCGLRLTTAQLELWIGQGASTTCR